MEKAGGEKGEDGDGDAGKRRKADREEEAVAMQRRPSDWKKRAIGWNFGVSKSSDCAESGGPGEMWME